MTRALDLTPDEHHEEKDFGPLWLPPHTCDDLNDQECGICRMRSQMYAHYEKCRQEYQIACRAARGEWAQRKSRRLILSEDDDKPRLVLRVRPLSDFKTTEELIEAWR
ncbi:hypothetical protein J2J97_32270 (plasmid) [Rhizobium bangladeshense]|uniref:hypothetical protein n=1 Tax=Rhizobium bangladeshense TaxID=1138189 RepID=UPI001A98C3FC|nr:hypothetical protein [Rhizobium bangladeshense]QSY98581.1 hypothetical protein J2J97_32270 [Rhizobium bangladeshense]